MIATAMSANVFVWIIPGQRKVVAQMKRRRSRSIRSTASARKQRSVHNTYFTLPVLVAMLSNHYGWLYQGRHNWIVLVLLMLAGALIRTVFVLRHKALVEGRRVPWEHAIAGTLAIVGTRRLAGAAAGRRRPRAAAAAPVVFAEVQAVVDQRCAMCHNAQLAQKNVALHTPELLEAACAGGLPAGRRAEADAAEQRDADDRRRARADQALVRGRRAGELREANSKERQWRR